MKRMMWAKITSLFIVFRMFQKRLRITQKLEVEFVARGRIWLLRFYMGKKGKWWIEYLLSEHSSPVHADTELQIQANKSPPGSGTPQHHSFYMYRSRTLVPEKLFHRNYYMDKETFPADAVRWPLDDWPMDNNNAYVDCDGALTARLKTTIK
jgi:hypothetical protein